MAEFALGLTKALVESLRVPGARTPPRLSTWSEDTPELPLILSLVAEAFLQLLASGLGALALIWATVVLLGGYSTTLVRTDFWFTTAIVFVQIARIVGYNSAPEAKFFVDVLAAFYQLKKHHLRGASATKIVRILAIGSTWIALAPIFLATACMSLSIVRLASIGGRHVYRSSSSGNVKPALILFYGLVLAQGALFLLWLAVAVNRMASVETLTKYYSSWQQLLPQQQRWRLEQQLQQLQQLQQQPQPQPQQQWLQRYRLQQQLQQLQQQQQHNLPRKLIDRYVNSIADTCTQKGVGSTINSTLVSFAAELLLQSQDQDDHSSAVVVLYSLVVKDTERSGRAAEQISCDEKLVSRLLWMLRSNNPVTKVCIAEIVVELATNYELRLVDIPGGARCISSLLDPHFMKKEEAANFFVRGLEILGKLASDSENCREIYNTMDLVPKIIAPVSNGLHMVMKDDDSTTTVEVVIAESLRVVAKLTSGTSESSRKLCEELRTAKYGRTAENILWILSNSDNQDMRVLAVEILSRLTLDESIMPKFTAKLRLLLSTCEDSPLGIEAGKALVARGDKLADFKRVDIIMSGDKYSKEYRAVTAEMFNLHNLFEPGHGKKLSILVAEKLLSKVFEAIVTETTNITQLDNSNRKFLASFLNLAVQIRENLVTARDFAVAVPGLSTGDNSFAEKLKSIIEVTKDSKSEDEACLAIMKSATKLVTWMMEIDDDRSPSYIEYFERYNIVEKLDAAVKAMVHLERYMVMKGGADENEGYVTLQTLVETVKNKLVPQQQPPLPPQKQPQPPLPPQQPLPLMTPQQQLSPSSPTPLVRWRSQQQPPSPPPPPRQQQSPPSPLVRRRPQQQPLPPTSQRQSPLSSQQQQLHEQEQ